MAGRRGGRCGRPPGLEVVLSDRTAAFVNSSPRPAGTGADDGQLSSPVSTLAYDLCSWPGIRTPRKRLDMRMVMTPPPPQGETMQRSLSLLSEGSDAGLCLDSPDSQTYDERDTLFTDALATFGMQDRSSLMRRVHSLPIELLGGSPALEGGTRTAGPLLFSPGEEGSAVGSPSPRSTCSSSTSSSSTCSSPVCDEPEDKENFDFKKPSLPLRVQHVGRGHGRRPTSAPSLTHTLVQCSAEEGAVYTGSGALGYTGSGAVGYSGSGAVGCAGAGGDTGSSSVGVFSTGSGSVADGCTGAGAVSYTGSGSSSTDEDDGFLEFSQSPGKEQQQQHQEAMVVDSPRGISSLINAPLVSHTLTLTPISRYSRQRCLFRSPSMPETGGFRANPRAGGGAGGGGGLCRPQPLAHKRAERTPGGTPGRNKRHRGEPEDQEQEEEEEVVQERAIAVRRKSMSACDAITRILDISPDRALIGDFTKPHSLPLVSGRDESLKYVSAETLSRVIRGDFHETIERFIIVDCRYPYEFDGGHITGAVNVVTELEAGERLLSSPVVPSSTDRRVVIVFHCEFSSERGPRMCRFVRTSDRNGNEYPHLAYPEIYILQGGYCAFYPDHMDLCEPRSYVPMLHCDFRDELQRFRQRSRSWAGDRGKHLLYARLKNI